AVEDLLDDLAADMRRGKFCQQPALAKKRLFRISRFILERIDAFEWRLTKDGHDYRSGGVGCGGLHSVSDKPSNTPCDMDRDHSLVSIRLKKKLTNRSLRIGH